jgi:RNA polymerase sigma-70 factor (ECF subfamily)
VLTDDVTIHSDGGGRTAAARVPLVGMDRVTRFLLGLYSKAQHLAVDVERRACEINGSPGIMQFVDGHLHSVASIEADGDRIRRLYFILNPDKLAKIAGDHIAKGE